MPRPTLRPSWSVPSKRLSRQGITWTGTLASVSVRPRALSIHPPGLGIGFGRGGVGQVFGTDAAVDLSDRGPLVGVGDHHPAPVLCVARGGRLHRQPHALENDVAFDRSRQVKAFAHRPRGGEQFVDRGDVHRSSDVDRAGLIDAENGQRPSQAEEDGHAQRQVEDLLVAEHVAQPSEKRVIDGRMVVGEPLGVLDRKRCLGV